MSPKLWRRNASDCGGNTLSVQPEKADWWEDSAEFLVTTSSRTERFRDHAEEANSDQ